MAQIVAHVRKIKTAVGVANVIAHNSRIKVYAPDGRELQSRQTGGAWYVPDRERFNRIDPLLPLGSSDLRPVYTARDRIINRAKEETEKAGGKWRKPGKNAAAGVEIVLSFSPSWAGRDGWTDSGPAKEKIDAFMRRGREWIAKKYGPAVLHLAEHWDEKTPHLHAVLVPITRNVRPPRTAAGGEVLKVYGPLAPGAWRYSSGDFFGGPAGLRDFQDEIAKVMKPLGLERGTVKSRAKHQSLAHHAGEVAELEKNIQDKKKELDGLADVRTGFNSEVLAFQKSLKGKLRGWQMPEAGPLESARKYRDRVAPEVMGKMTRALDTYDKAQAKERQLELEKVKIDDLHTRMDRQLSRLEGTYGSVAQAQEYIAQMSRKKAPGAARKPPTRPDMDMGY